MDRRYRYTPNSRSARRLRDKKRKKRRNRRIAVTIVFLLAVFAGVFGALKIFKGNLPEFDPITGASRLAASIKNLKNGEENSAPTAEPADNTADIQQEPDGEGEPMDFYVPDDLEDTTPVTNV